MSSVSIAVSLFLPVRVPFCKTTVSQAELAMECLSERLFVQLRLACWEWWGNFFLSFRYPRRKKNNKTGPVNKGVSATGCLLLLKRPQGSLPLGWKQTFVKDFILEVSKDTRGRVRTRGRKRHAQRGEEMKGGRRQESHASLRCHSRESQIQAPAFWSLEKWLLRVDAMEEKNCWIF